LSQDSVVKRFLKYQHVLVFIAPVLAGHSLDAETIVKVGLISESFGLSSSFWRCF
jgi:hypothetical protein